MTTDTFTPAMAYAERLEIARAGGIRRWTRKRIIGATAIGYSLVERPDKSTVKAYAAPGARPSVTGRSYIQGADGVTRRKAPKVRQSKKARLAARRVEAAREKFYQELCNEDGNFHPLGF